MASKKKPVGAEDVPVSGGDAEPAAGAGAGDVTVGETVPRQEELSGNTALAPRLRARNGESSAAPRTAQYLTFFVDGEEYAAGILRIVEIVEYQPLTRVPTTPPWIRGVMNLRGRVIPVVDLALKFSLEPTAVTRRTCVVVLEVDLEGEPTVMGVLVDEVGRVLDLALEAIEEPPPFGTRVRIEFLLGLGNVDGKFVLVLDVDRVLSTDELMEVAAAPEAGEAGAEEDDAGSEPAPSSAPADDRHPSEILPAALSPPRPKTSSQSKQGESE